MKLDRHELQKQLFEHIDVLNERFKDRKFKIINDINVDNKTYNKASLDCLKGCRRSTVISSRPKKQLLEAIKLFDLGSYMFQESTGYFD